MGLGVAAITGIASALFNGVTSTIKTIASESTVRGGLLLNYMGKQSSNAASVMKTAMNHNIYWYVWGTAAFVSVAWYAAVMIDTITNGATPDVATLPASVKPYFDIVWQNLFWTGAAGYGIHSGTRLIERIWRL